MLSIKTRADLERLIEEGLQESLTLEYKASQALQKSSEARAELVKDVTAFANSAGGQIIYGVRERNGSPQSIDGGVDIKIFSPEWIGQVLETNSSPRVQGMQIDKIVLDDGNPMLVALVLSIPAATAFAPHQNSIDMKYYRRFEARSVPMHDYEIRDVLRRGRVPELEARFTFADGKMLKMHRFPDEQIEIETIMENLSSEPALYSLFDFYVDKKLIITNEGGFASLRPISVNELELYRLQKQFITPNDFPLLKGSNITVGPPRLTIQIPQRYYGKSEQFVIGYSAASVGFTKSEFVAIFLIDNVLRIEKFSDSPVSETVIGQSS